MASSKSVTGPEDRDSGSWANETLPLSVRRELLDRELSKLGFRKAGAHGAGPLHPQQEQQQPRGNNGHPQADGDGGGEHSE